MTRWVWGTRQGSEQPERLDGGAVVLPRGTSHGEGLSFAEQKALIAFSYAWCSGLRVDQVERLFFYRWCVLAGRLSDG